MLKKNEEYTEKEHSAMVLNGSSFAVFVANKDREKFAQFKENGNEDLSDSDVKSMNILLLLEKLGYPMDELGTYLYKEVIFEISESLKEITGKRSDMEKCRFLLKELNNGFSNFYFEIAREYLEMGVKPFHLCIEDTINKIDSKKINTDVFYDIFGSFPKEQNYGLQAFQIAAYTLGFSINKDVNPPMVKKLSNIPDNIRLKAQYF